MVALLLGLCAPGASFAAGPLWESVMRQRPSFGYALAVDPAGYIYAGGAWSDSRTTVLFKPFIRKYATDGTVLWTRTVAPGGTTSFVESVRGIAVLAGGDVVAAGQWWAGSANKLDGWISRYTSSGDLVWTVTINGTSSGNDAINSVALAPDGRIVVAGWMDSTAWPGRPSFWIGRYLPTDGSPDPAGSRVLATSYTAWPDMALDVAVDSSGSIYATGVVGDWINGCTDLAVVKLTPSLSYLAPDGWWMYVAGTSVSSTDYGAGIAIAPDGDVLVCGSVTDAGMLDNAWVGKVSATAGTVVWSITVDGGEGDYDLGGGIAAAADGSVYACGALDTLYPLPGSAQDAWVGKFSPAGAESWRYLRDFRANSNDYAARVRVYGADVFTVGTLKDPDNGPTFWLARLTDDPPANKPDIRGVTPAPNPWRPGSGGRYDTPGMRFLNLPAGAHVRLYTLTGALVVDLVDDDNDGVVAWDGKNSGGSDAVSGVYIYAVVPKSGDTTRGKVVIVR